MQQAGALFHITRVGHFLLSKLFPNSQIARYGSMDWPGIVPDLTPLDFFLLEFVKDKVYWAFVSSSLYPEKQRKTVIKAVSQEFLNNVCIDLGNLLQPTFRELSVHIEGH